jgi:plasmid segregation protein ParM
MMDTIGLDVGRSAVKVYTGASMFHFPSVIGEYRDRRLVTDYGDKGFTFEYADERYFVGTLAENESDFARSMMTEDKTHMDTRILALTAIHRAGLTEVNVVTGLPVESHNDDNKRRLRELLAGRYDVTVNGERRIIRINDVKIAVEGGSAFWSSPVDGFVRLVDAGAKTVNYVTMRDRRYVDRDSGTLPFGFNTNKTDNLRQMSARIAGELGKRWGTEDNVVVSGGRAVELAEALMEYYPNAKAINSPLYANAIGFFRIGKATL